VEQTRAALGLSLPLRHLSTPAALAEEVGPGHLVSGLVWLFVDIPPKHVKHLKDATWLPLDTALRLAEEWALITW
jgi:hypothetical protein